MPASPPYDLADERVALGRRLALLRKAAGYTQQGLAPLTLYGRSTVANVESGRQSVGRDFWARCDDVLGTDGVLTAQYDRLRTATSPTYDGAAMHQVKRHGRRRPGRPFACAPRQ